MKKSSRKKPAVDIEDKSKNSNFFLISTSFFLGIAISILFFSIIITGEIKISLQDFISLIFTVSLGTASIVLALMAIRISKDSEEILIKRGNENVELQMDLFIKTEEALKEIRSSTAIMERRQEDLISKTEGIARDVIQKIPDKKTREDTEKQLKRSFRKLHSEREEEISEFDREGWDKFNKDIFDSIKKFPSIKIISHTEGTLTSSTSEEFWDTIFKFKNKKCALDVHTSKQFDISNGSYSEFVHDKGEREDYLRKILWRANEDNLDLVFIVCEKNVWEEEGLSKIKKYFEEFSKSRKKPRIFTLFGDPETLTKKIEKEVNKK